MAHSAADAAARSTTVGGLRPGDHACLAYDSAEERRAILTTYLRDALRAGEAVLYLVDDEPTALAAARLREEFATPTPKPAAPKPDASGPGAPKSDVSGPGVSGPDAPKPDACEPGASGPGASEPGVFGPGAPQPDAPTPGACGPGVSGPGVSGPGACESDALKLDASDLRASKLGGSVPRASEASVPEPGVSEVGAPEVGACGGDLVAWDVGAALDDGRIVVLSAGADGAEPAGLESALAEAIEAALRRGHPGVRVVADASPALRGWPGTERFAAFEDAVGRAVAGAGGAVRALCQYDRRWFAADHVRALEACHEARVRADDVFDDGVLTITPLFAPPGLRLAGAIDESTLPALVAALREVDRRAAHLCLDLSRLDFCDLDGLRTLIEANRTSAVVDRQVILRSMPGCMELMMRVSGLEAAPGIVKEGAR
ncbi:MEDS domain-containing protein [Actinomadura fibrosa]|uniref:MEDS domain-containing protein n=1 Tax=Actinomadura fibrosa TaxID=111802 RepID=A0ABW2XQS1_9ACTN|nr:MEDS domain-containing protein [Actinomadura fibrosa]